MSSQPPSSSPTSLASPIMFFIANLENSFANNANARTENEEIIYALLQRIPVDVRNQAVQIVKQSLQDHPTYNPQRLYSHEQIQERLQRLSNSDFILDPAARTQELMMSTRVSYTGYLRRSDPLPDFFKPDLPLLPNEEELEQ